MSTPNTKPINPKVDFSENRIIVKFKSPKTMEAFNSFNIIKEPTIMDGIQVNSARIINPPPAKQLSAVSIAYQNNQGTLVLIELADTGLDAVSNAIKRFEENKDEIEYAERDYKVKLVNTNTPSDKTICGSGCLYGMKKIKAPQAWDVTTGNKSIVVGIIDTGIDTAHPALRQNIWKNPNVGKGGYENDLHGYDFILRRGIDDSYSLSDLEGHGTHVAGTVGAHGNDSCSIIGVAPNIQLAVIKAIDDGSGDISAIIEAINYVNNMGILITNNSYTLSSESRALKEVVTDAGLFIIAAGNNNDDIEKIPVYPAAYGLDNLITVAATDQNDSFAPFSCYSKKLVHLAAPGMDICSARPRRRTGLICEWDTGGYITECGTSMAAPHVAGAAALVLSKLIEETSYDENTSNIKNLLPKVKDRLLTNVDCLPELNSKVSTGGRLNVFKALKNQLD